MHRGRIGSFVVAALAVLALAGCSDSPSAGDQPPAQNNGPQPTQPTQPSSDGDTKKGADGYCKTLQDKGDVLSKFGDQSTLSGDEKATVKKNVDLLADEAPSDLKPAMTSLADFFGKIVDGEIKSAEDFSAEDTAKFTTAMQQFSLWVGKNCAGYDIEMGYPTG